MIAHCIYPALDDQISSISRKVVHDLLRVEMGFKGIITTDSMTMGALITKYGTAESCARALQAGSDIILMKAENQWRGEMFEWSSAGSKKVKSTRVNSTTKCAASSV
jgi:beta-N-acetylhexosaminidase